MAAPASLDDISSRASNWSMEVRSTNLRKGLDGRFFFDERFAICAMTPTEAEML